MERDNEFFYIFINIKGALYTADWVKFVQSALQEQDAPEYKNNVDNLIKKHPQWNRFYKAKGYEKSKHIRKICAYNVDALNRLLDDLKLDYNVNLVITSPKWKDAFDLKTIPALVKNGLNYNNMIIDKTDNKIEDTYDGITTYLAQVGNPSNYLVIDYQDSVCKMFESSKVIKVDQYSDGLTEELVDNYLDTVEFGEEYVNGAEVNFFEEFELA